MKLSNALAVVLCASIGPIALAETSPQTAQNQRHVECNVRDSAGHKLTATTFKQAQQAQRNVVDGDGEIFMYRLEYNLPKVRISFTDKRTGQKVVIDKMHMHANDHMKVLLEDSNKQHAALVLHCALDN